MSDAKDVTFSLKIMTNKKKTKVLFAEGDSHFADVLLSFLTLPLGRIVEVLEKHYGDKAPAIGSLNTLYKGLANLDSAHFWTEGAKSILLNPRSSVELQYNGLKLDISDSQPAEYFFCENCSSIKFSSVSMYYDDITTCQSCWDRTLKKAVEKQESRGAACGDGVFTKNTVSFIITDDMQMLPNVKGFLQTINLLGITDSDEAELMNVTFGFGEVMDLLKASLISPTPWSDLILNKARQINHAKLKAEQGTLPEKIDMAATSNSKKMILKVMVQKSTSKLLFAQAKEDFIEFLFSVLTIPLAGVEHLLHGITSIKSIDNFYRSVSDLIDNNCLKTSDTKDWLIKPKLPHGCISKNQILPLTEECLPGPYSYTSLFSSTKFPKGQGNYMKGPGNYKVTDDLTVTPFCIASTLSVLNGLKIPLSGVRELELEIGLEEALSILKASLTSTSALTDGLMNRISKKQPKQERGRV